MTAVPDHSASNLCLFLREPVLVQDSPLYPNQDQSLVSLAVWACAVSLHPRGQPAAPTVCSGVNHVSTMKREMAESPCSFWGAGQHCSFHANYHLTDDVTAKWMLNIQLMLCPKLVYLLWGNGAEQAENLGDCFSVTCVFSQDAEWDCCGESALRTHSQRYRAVTITANDQLCFCPRVAGRNGSK